MKTIFITIPAYEDPELIDTIESALSNAANPKNIFIGIALQYKKCPMPDMGRYFRNKNIKTVYYDVDKRPGVNQVRHNLLDLYSGQDYYLMIDSHSTFMPYWDQILINEYEKIREESGKEKVIISQLIRSDPGILCDCYNTNVVCEEEHETNYYVNTGIRLSGSTNGSYGVHNPIRLWERASVPTDRNYQPSAPAAAGFFFADAKWISDVGIVDGVEALSEEFLLSFRSYISGWDIYRLKNINPVAHNNVRYNMFLYGDVEVRDKTYTRLLDPYETLQKIEELAIFNSGPFSVKNAERSPEQFWENAGLWAEFVTIKGYMTQDINGI